MSIRTAFIGSGKRAGFFSKATQAVGEFDIVGYADPVEDAAVARAEEFGGEAFTDSAEMLRKTQPEFVMLITRPNVRLEPIRLCAEAGVKTMLAEKPMAPSWGEAKEIQKVATDSGMQLNFCHQRRCEAWYEQAKQIIESGRIGKLMHLVAHCDNFFDWGTHWFDMMHNFNGEVEAEWVIAQAERTEPRYIFDQPLDRFGISVVKFANGVIGTLHSGGAQAETSRMRAIGDEGTLVVGDGGKLTWFDANGKNIGEYGDDALPGLPAALTHVKACIESGKPGMLDSANALRATQLIFASYHSGMVGGQIELPLPDDFDLSMTDVFGPDAR